MKAESASPFRVGGGLFDLLIIGMYDGPLAVYREYIQNSCDAIETLGQNYAGRIDIEVCPMSRNLRIRDNGPGLKHSEIERDLITVADSRKTPDKSRGFRGVGRLCGLAFADSVTFRTRAHNREKVFELTWNGVLLRKYARERKVSLRETIEHSVKTAEIEGTGWPDHFFEVEINNVARHVAGEILNSNAVRAYISAVCPVPLNSDFPFAKDVEAALNFGDRALLAHDVRVSPTHTPVQRPFSTTIRMSNTSQQRFTDFESFHIGSVDGKNLAAIGWIAHSEYLGAIPKQHSIRGLRARLGNVQIGKDDVFEHLFSESRFNSWCVGEVHVFDPRILPNSRRDYFEPGPHARNLENQLRSITRKISGMCRSASTGRLKQRKLHAEIGNSETIYKIVASGFLNSEDSHSLVQILKARVLKLLSSTDWPNQEQAQLEELISKFQQIDLENNHHLFGRIPSADIPTYRRVFGMLTKSCPTAQIALNTIERVLLNSE